MANKKDWYKSRAIWIAIATSVAGIITAFVAEYPVLQSVGVLMLLKGLVDVFIRLDTFQGIKGVE